jgi:hypothetical protein
VIGRLHCDENNNNNNGEANAASFVMFRLLVLSVLLAVLLVECCSTPHEQHQPELGVEQPTSTQPPIIARGGRARGNIIKRASHRAESCKNLCSDRNDQHVFCVWTCLDAVQCARNALQHLLSVGRTSWLIRIVCLTLSVVVQRVPIEMHESLMSISGRPDLMQFLSRSEYLAIIQQVIECVAGTPHVRHEL